MDWFSWLSKTGLNPTLVYEYGLTFSNNELEEDDIPYLDHEFLQSMGISVAKHRLEILKLARKHHWKGSRVITVPASRLLFMMRGMKRKLREYIRGWTGCEEPSAIVVVRTKVGEYYGSGAGRSRVSGTKLKRNRRTSGGGGGEIQGRLLLMDGRDSGAVPAILMEKREGKLDEHDNDRYWEEVGVEEVRWDALFKDMKPT